MDININLSELQDFENSYNTEFASVIRPYYERIKQDCDADENVVPFIMQWGSVFKEAPIKIMFYGRATNGWAGSWNLDECFDLSNKERGYSPDNQMVWVENQWDRSEDGYVTKKSQFWKVIRQISTSIFKDKWYRYVCWSNVCKVAPIDSGNPSDSLYYRTLESNQHIFETEINYWKPHFVVLFTGGDWSNGGDWSKDFLVHMNKQTMPDLYVERIWDTDFEDRKLKVYLIDGIYYIVSLHPQGKKISPHANCIFEVINELKDAQDSLPRLQWCIEH